jgi:drug/metabolite transporter (DMT)-like permease
MRKNNLTLKIILFLLSSDILETFTQFCFKKSAIPESGFVINSPLAAVTFIKIVLLSGYLWLGLISVFLTFIIWSTLLSKIDLSVAVPIASFSYILVPLVSMIFLREQVSFLDWTGILFILIGVIIVAGTSNKPEAIVT